MKRIGAAGEIGEFFNKGTSSARLAVELRLPVQKGERGEADALIEIGHEGCRSYATADWCRPYALERC